MGLASGERDRCLCTRAMMRVAPPGDSEVGLKPDLDVLGRSVIYQLIRGNASHLKFRNSGNIVINYDAVKAMRVQGARVSSLQLAVCGDGETDC